MNKYYQMMEKILHEGKMQDNKKGAIKYLLDQQLSLTPADLLDIFEGHPIARKKLKNGLALFMHIMMDGKKQHGVVLLPTES